MSGREPDEGDRRASPLELLFDLTFVVSFAQASDAGAHLLAVNDIGGAVAAFTFTAVAICWAWINFSWFASGFDTDDWLFRVTTMVQMAGVIVLALGVQPVFDSIHHGNPVNVRVIVAGYVVVRFAMLAQWIRVATQDAAHRPAAFVYATTITIAQVGWLALAAARPDDLAFVVAVVGLYAVEMGGPVIAKRSGGGTPWHPHHIAERYGLMLIIALGEGIVATIAAVNAAVQSVGWTSEAVLLVVAGTGLTLALWWDYFIVPFGTFLTHHRRRTWGVRVRPHPDLHVDRRRRDEPAPRGVRCRWPGDDRRARCRPRRCSADVRVQLVVLSACTRCSSGASTVFTACCSWGTPCYSYLPSSSRMAGFRSDGACSS
jgi:low temperature requirement protein LtrA